MPLVVFWCVHLMLVPFHHKLGCGQQVCRIQSYKNHHDLDLWIHRVDIKGSDLLCLTPKLGIKTMPGDANCLRG